MSINYYKLFVLQLMTGLVVWIIFRIITPIDAGKVNDINYIDDKRPF